MNQMKKSSYLLLPFFLILPFITFAAVETIDLSGVWRFKTDPANAGEQEHWYNTVLDDQIKLPGSMVENLKGDDISLQTKFTGSIYDSSWFFNPRMAKYRKPEHLKMPFWLTQIKRYEGLAWYQRDVVITELSKNSILQLYLEHPHFATKVWIDDQLLGEFVSMTVPHVYDLGKSTKPGKHRLTIRVDNRLKSMDVGTNSHSVTDHTQGNWNGITGRLELQSFSPVYVDDVQVFPDIHKKLALVRMKVINRTGSEQKISIRLSASGFNTKVQHETNQLSKKVAVLNGEMTLEIPLDMGNDVQLWDEFTPALYKLKVNLEGKKLSDERVVQFGMREVSIDGKYICINGRKTLLRGTVENAVFPLTGYPPHDVDSWERVFRICKDFGLNHMRFHSFSPPEAAFIAADKLGFYLQPEGPSWPNHSTQLGRGLPIDTFLMNETKRMVRYYGNYASFTFLACGNEPRGNWVRWVSDFVNYWRKTDNRRIYTGASVGGGWAWQPANQYHVKAGARGLNWKDVQPESYSDFSKQIDTVRQPFVSHETGQWCVFPDFSEIKKYTGVTRARNFELFQEDLADNGMASQAHDFLIASGRLQTLCYKHEIERTMRTPGYAGFQLLSLNDYPGQGTALVGVLNAFWETKGYVTADEFRRFCNSTVPLAQFEKFVFNNSEPLKANILVSHFDTCTLKNAVIDWTLKDNQGKAVAKGSLPAKTIVTGNGNDMGLISASLQAVTEPRKLNLEVVIRGTNFANDWNVWVYPSDVKIPKESPVFVADTFNQDVRARLERGESVLLLAAGKVSYGKDVVQHYQPAFWNTSWFKMRPPHTTGVLVKNTHPVFNDFVTDNWADLQWWELINKAQTMMISDFPSGFEPIVQPIDTWFINRKLAMLFEAKVGKGKLIMTSIDLKTSINTRLVARQLLVSILNYMHSEQFKPTQQLKVEDISTIFTKIAAPINSFSNTSPDELKKGVQ